MSNPAFIQTVSLPYEKESKIENFEFIRLKIASPEEILSWSYGEVTKPETINYRSQKPERDGLFCEKIFGPVKDWQCACGKYKKLRYRGIICDRCGVEVTRSLVRRERMGHISLAAPVAHIWFLRGIPSKIGLILDCSIQTLEKVVYFANFIITKVNEEVKKSTSEQLKEDFLNRKKQLKKEMKDREKLAEHYQALQEKYEATKKEIEEIRVKKLLSESAYHELSLKYGYFFEASIGAEAILSLLSEFNLKELVHELEKEKEKNTNPAKQKKIILRFKLAKNLLNQKIKPEWMILKVLPIIPPELRPMVQLDGERFASSDLNDLYRRVINRNNRLKRLIELQAPEVICRNEKRMLQEAVDALIDQKMRQGKTVTAGMSKRPLKSLADNLRGKQGRFRQNLLGKRVDYSARSVIVVGPELKLHECGLPKVIAQEIFKPFVMSELIKREIVHNVRSASRFIESGADEVWDILEEITKKSYVLLNRAPTLHRLGIQAFKPILIEGKAIQIHPLVCHPFNADFDGDQMAVHLPLSSRAQEEAKEIMLSSKNLLKPATGEPVMMPTKDMIWGAYWLTLIREPKNKKFFSQAQEAFLAYENKRVGIQDKIVVRDERGEKNETSVGRLIFASVLPEEIKVLDKVVDGKVLKEIVIRCYQKLGREKTAEMLDAIKEITFKYLTLSGLSWGMNDLPEIKSKDEIIKKAEKEIDEIQKQYEEGLLAEDERYLKSLDVWIKVRDQIANLCRNILPPYSPVLSMIESGARGSWSQLTQMFGIKGLVSSPSGKIIELPIKSSLQEGFNVLEYFISTHGARKGVSDTALRTASAGYLTRRMVDVAQDLIVREKDCGDKEGVIFTKEESEEMGETLAHRISGRVVLENIFCLPAGQAGKKTKKVLVKKGDFVRWEMLKKIEKIDLQQIKIRSVLRCKTRWGVCVKCYGFDLGYSRLVEIGTTVGIIAGQSIGEPGTQLTLRTFHTGGIVGRDITHGLPRIEELLETRPPKKKAILAQRDYLGVKKIEGEWQKKITLKYINPEGKEEEEAILIPSNYLLWVKEEQKVKKGDPLTDGSFNLHELYQLKGKEAVEKYILKEVKHIYSSQGQRLNDKHVEIIIRQLFSRQLIEESGDTDLLPGEILPRSYIDESNKETSKRGGKPAKAKELLLGMTRVSLCTQSFLSAASFQESSRVLINAAVSGRPDPLLGLKENVIIGRLIPVKEKIKRENKQ